MRIFRCASGRDGAQMLLLTAVVLLIGFIALSSMVVRVSQLPEETVQESRRPIDLEAGAMAEGVGKVLDEVAVQVPITAVQGSDPYETAVLESLEALAVVEASRGFRFEVVPDLLGDLVTCTDVPLYYSTLTITVALQDVDTRVQVTLSRTFGTMDDPAPCDIV